MGEPPEVFGPSRGHPRVRGADAERYPGTCRHRHCTVVGDVDGPSAPAGYYDRQGPDESPSSTRDIAVPRKSIASPGAAEDEANRAEDLKGVAGLHSFGRCRPHLDPNVLEALTLQAPCPHGRRLHRPDCRELHHRKARQHGLIQSTLKVRDLGAKALQCPRPEWHQRGGVLHDHDKAMEGARDERRHVRRELQGQGPRSLLVHPADDVRSRQEVRASRGREPR
mmetsp:Transcript_119794/g.255620  ORF Transcript_119794/g.255620 Transcript_119794/m.255620 type:complete len:224 (+) Transcript_119794:317-988(+)